MKIGDVAERLGIPVSTIRYYEKVGLIEHQRRVSGRRDFDERALFALQFIQLAQAAGFTIVEMKSLLESYAKDPIRAGLWKPFVETKKMAIRQQIETLNQMDRVLTEFANCRCSTLAECVRLANSDRRLNVKKKNDAATHRDTRDSCSRNNGDQLRAGET